MTYRKAYQFYSSRNFPPLADQLPILKEMGYDPSYQTFPMEHSVCLEEIQDIGRFIRRHLL